LHARSGALTFGAQVGVDGGMIKKMEVYCGWRNYRREREDVLFFKKEALGE
jgi:hypothetical protein